MMLDLAANAVLLGADAAILALLRKKRDPKLFAKLLVLCGLAAPIVAVLLLFVVGLFGAMRVCAWAIFIHGIVVFAGAAILLRSMHRKSAVAAAVAAILIAFVGIDAFFIEPHSLEVTRYRIASPKLKRPLRIAILADLQTDVIGGHEWKVFQLLSAEKPDLILLAGDYIQEHDDGRRKDLYRELVQMMARAPYSGAKSAIAVEGNCDSPDWTEPLEASGITCTRDTRAFREGEIQVTALSLGDSFNPRLTVEGTEAFHIVLGHAPDFALGDVRADLLVAGHTHGGQVRLPGIGPLITLSSIPRSWAAGMTELSGGRTLVVSRGIGMERGRAPRLRFLCRPELVILEVVPGP